MKVPAIVCLECNTVIFSRAPHDFRYCKCQKSFIDGGFSGYSRYGGDHTKQHSFLLDVKATEKDLYDDWNHPENHWGYYPSPWPKWVGEQAGCELINKVINELTNG